MNAALERALVTLENEKNIAIRAEVADSICELAFEAPVEARPEFGPAVVRLLADKQDEVRCAGLALASEVLAPIEARDVLSRHLNDAVARVRVEAAGRLADLALPESRGALAAALNDQSLAVRFEAARGMVALEHAAGFEVLVEALQDPELRYRAAAALAQLGKKEAVEPLRKAFRGWFMPAFDRTQMAGALAVLGDSEGLEHLYKRLGKKFAIDRPMAVELLGEVKPPDAKARLLQILVDRDDPARGTSARALGRLGDLTAEPPLTALLNDTTVIDDVRLDAAEGLLLLGSDSARERVKATKLADKEAAAELDVMIREYEDVSSALKR
ncbi:MAG: HEAT repeat domain-containing protein [Archangium sp.]